jgi:MoxR-like ATPase
MPCPDRDDELTLVRRTLGADAPENVLASGEVKPVATAARLTALRAELRHVTVQPELLGYAVDVVRATRANESVLVGAGPRASQALLLAARALAALQDRDFVTPDDLKFLAGPVLGHRLVLRPEFELEGTSVGEVVTRILETVAVPR